MKKKIYNRPACIMLSQKMFEQISELTKQREISISDHIRVAIQEKLANEKAIMIINKED
jgi:hypothetical protein